MKHLLLLVSFFVTISAFRTAEAIPLLAAKPNSVQVTDSTQLWDSLVARYKVTNNPLALHYARQAMKYANALNTDKQRIKAFMLLGEVFQWSEKDSSYIYYSLAERLSHNDSFKRERVEILTNLAQLYKFAQDLQTAIIFLDSAIRLAEEAKHYSIMSDAYNILGNIRKDIKAKEEARAMYDSSFRIAQRHSLYRQMGVALGNLAKFETNYNLSLQKHLEAISYLKKAKGSDQEIAIILVGIGLIYVNNPDSSLFYFDKALKMGIKNNFFEVQMAAYNNMAYCYLDKKDVGKAEISIKRAINIAEKAADLDWLPSLYDTYADILTFKGEYNLSSQFQKKAYKTRVAADEKQSAGQLRLLAALLDTKNKEIFLQNKENELLTQTNRLQSTRLWLILAIILIVAVLYIFSLYQQRSRMKLKTEQIASAKRIIEMDESEKGRIARELHDITGQLVMGITSEIENLEIPSSVLKGEIQNKIKMLGKSIRQISHRMNRAMMEHFSFEELLTGQCEDVQKITGIPISLHLPKRKIILSQEAVLHIYRIVQELLTNASKYVKDGEVYITVKCDNLTLTISYSDTGPGFDTTKKKFMGMGIMNIHERIKLLGGVAKIEASPGNGTNWELIIPLVNQKVNK